MTFRLPIEILKSVNSFNKRFEIQKFNNTLTAACARTLWALAIIKDKSQFSHEQK